MTEEQELKDAYDAQPYVQKVKDILATLKPGTVTAVHVYHDDDCPSLAGGFCNCDARVEAE